MSEERGGGCLCGAVRFRALGLFRPVMVCHCRQCAQWTGYLVAATAVSAENFVIVSGDNGVRWFRSSEKAERAFCATCGSSGANLTFASCLRPSSRSNVKFKSSTRLNKLLVVLVIQTVATAGAAQGGKCLNRTTSLFWRHDDRPHVAIMAGVFDQPSGLKLDCHAHVADCADYDEIGAVLPRHDGLPEAT